MSIAPTVPGIQSLTLVATQEIHVRATLEDIFAALLEQIGPDNDTPEGKAMPMKIEPWPGGRCIAIWATETDISGDTCRPCNPPTAPHHEEKTCPKRLCSHVHILPSCEPAVPGRLRVGGHLGVTRKQ